jgi:iron-sulfur cluster assembly protein
MITITDSAKQQIQKLMSESNLDESHFLRVGVKGGGCAGFSYQMDFDTEFKEGDELFEDSGVRIVCDRLSILYIFGTELHFSGGLNGKGFEWKNPNANRTCSCGISFST